MFLFLRKCFFFWGLGFLGRDGGMRVVHGVVEAAAFLAFHGLAHYQIGYVDDVAQLAEFARGLAYLEELFGLFVEDVEAVPGAFQAQVGAHDAYVVAHYLVHLFNGLRDEHHLFGVDCAFVVPFGNVVAQIVAGDDGCGMARGRVGVDDGFYQRI